MAGRIVKCAYCGLGVPKDEAKRHKDKNYHSECLKEQIDKEELTNFICRLFSLKAPGPRIYAQIKSYLEKNNYTYKGILQALQFFYEIQKHSTDKSNQGIGIVPYVYDAAQEYYNNISLRQERVATAISGSLDVQPTVIKVQKKEKKKKLLYDIDNL